MTEFITRNYGNKEYEIIIKTDNKEHYKAAENFIRQLIGHAKPTEHIPVLSGYCPICNHHIALHSEDLSDGALE